MESCQVNEKTLIQERKGLVLRAMRPLHLGSTTLAVSQHSGDTGWINIPFKTLSVESSMDKTHDLGEFFC